MQSKYFLTTTILFSVYVVSTVCEIKVAYDFDPKPRTGRLGWLGFLTGKLHSLVSSISLFFIFMRYVIRQN